MCSSSATATPCCATCFDAATRSTRSRAEIDDVFDRYPRGRGRERQGRVPLRDAQPQRRVPGGGRARSRILEVIEPLLGDDCHVIANTAWRNPPTSRGGPWHCDAGPHVPRPGGRPVGRPHPVPGVRDRRAPPAAGLHPCRRPDRGRARQSHRAGGSRRSTGSPTRTSRTTAVRPCYSRPTPATSRCSYRTCGIAARRRAGGDGRLFLQVHYGRRDIAQRIRTTDEVNHLSPEAIERAQTQRQRDARRPARSLLLRRVAGAGRKPKAPPRPPWAGPSSFACVRSPSQRRYAANACLLQPITVPSASVMMLAPLGSSAPANTASP